MRIKLYLFLPRAEAEELVRSGFPDSNRGYRLNPADYTACSAFNPKSLVEIDLELDREELARYRQQLELPFDEDAAGDEEFAGPAAEPIHWYELPAQVLRTACRSCRFAARGQ